MHMGLMWGNLKESDHLEEQSADGTMLKLVLKKKGRKWNWSGSRYGTEADSRELNNEV